MDEQFTEIQLWGVEWGWDPVQQQENHLKAGTGCLAQR